MDQRAPLALYQILDAIKHFRIVLGSADVAELAVDLTRRYAAERCIEIISEASRRIPDEWKSRHPAIPWSDIAGIRNVLRHNYEEVNLQIIVKLRNQPLEDLAAAVSALLNEIDPEGAGFRDPT
jgi:uncharacterized protein with HEPN domain